MPNLKKSFLMGTAAAGAALLASSIFFILAVNAACTNPSTTPTGFAAPCPVFSLSSTSVSQSQTLTLSATPQAGTDYIYTTAYVSEGTTWNPHTLAGNNAYPSGPVVSISPTTLAFPSQTVGTTSAVEYDTLTNTGNATLNFISDAITGDFAFGGLGSCGTPLAVGSSCTYSAKFTPTAIGIRTGTITINTNASNTPTLIPLSGTGVSSYSYSQASYYAYSQGTYYVYSQS